MSAINSLIEKNHIRSLLLSGVRIFNYNGDTVRVVDFWSSSEDLVVTSLQSSTLIEVCCVELHPILLEIAKLSIAMRFDASISELERHAENLLNANPLIGRWVDRGMSPYRKLGGGPDGLPKTFFLPKEVFLLRATPVVKGAN